MAVDCYRHCIDNDSFCVIFNQLTRYDHESCRLVCYDWRVSVDWYLRNRVEKKKAKPVLDFLSENDFLRMAMIAQAQEEYRDEDFCAAFRHFSAAASYEKGNARAMFMIGHMFLLGKGIKKSIREGFYQLNNAAEAGYGPAACDLGLIFHHGCDVEGNEIVLDRLCDGL